MAKRKTKSVWLLVLLLFAGILIGTVLGSILGNLTGWGIFTNSIQFGTSGSPVWIDLFIFKFCFGISFKVNFGSAIGTIVALVLYYTAK